MYYKVYTTSASHENVTFAPANCNISQLEVWVHNQHFYEHKSNGMYFDQIQICYEEFKSNFTTSRVTNIACPMCREPVTLGGGIEITNGSLPRSNFGLKKPWDSHLISKNYNQYKTMLIHINENVLANTSEPVHTQLEM
jgi:hypothetical protein